VVGDPNILSLDPLWRSFLNHVYVNGGWVGDAPGWDTDAEVAEAGGYDTELRELGLSNMNEFMRRMETLTLSNAHAEDGEEDEQQAEANFDRPWQEKE
jgi:helicase MOV-10